MKKLVLFVALFAFAVGIQSCTKEKKEEAPAEKPAAEQPAAEEPAAEEPAKPAEVGDTGGQIGVPECDEYISKVQKCVSDKVPAAAKSALEQGFNQNIEAWKKAAASSPQAKATLATACKTALDTAKQSLGAYGCEF